MKRMLFLIIAIGTTTILFAQQQFSIYANLTGFKDGTKFNLTDPEMQMVIDSAILKNNSFVITGKLDYVPKGLFLSANTEGNYYWCYLFIGNEKVTLKGDRKDFPFYLHVNGSKSQDIYNKLNEKTRSLMTRRNALTENLGSLLSDESDSAKTKLKSIGKQLNHIDSLTDSIKMVFIKSNLNSYPALNELYYLRTKFSRDSLQHLYNKLKDEYKESTYGERLVNYIKVGEILKVGDKFADFEAQDKFGKTNKLSQYIGKYILLDFTETYCGPCILSVDELKEIAKDYSDSLTIISFCADKSKKVWNKGLERDKPTWANLWNGEGTYGQTVLKYGVYGYPTFFLINPDGKIISKWSGYGKGNLIENISKKVPKNENGR